MSETAILWIFGAVMVIGGGWLSAITIEVREVSKSQGEQLNRITRLEMTLIMISETAAKLLHADDNFHGLDKYIDKYLDRNYELTMKEWNELLDKFELVMNDPKMPRDTRLSAALVYHICRHKLMLPPDKTKGVEQEQHSNPLTP
jgi:hypothetical protein